MVNYALSIEDRVKTEGRITERAVMAGSVYFTCEKTYDPTAETSFNYEGTEFATPSSIVHPFRSVAMAIAKNHDRTAKGDMNMPRIKYDPSVNDAQKRLFETILGQEYEALLTRKVDALRRKVHGSE